MINFATKNYEYSEKSQFNLLLVLQVDERGYIKSCSEKILQLLNYNKKDIIKIHISHIIDFITSEYQYEEIKGILDSGIESLNLEQRIITAYNRSIPVYTQYWYEQEETSKSKYLNINFIDISSRKKNDINLKERLLTREQILNQLDISIGVIDDIGEFIYINNSMEHMIQQLGCISPMQKNISIFGSTIAKKVRDIIEIPKLKYEFEQLFDLNQGPRWFKIVLHGLCKNKCIITIRDIQNDKFYSEIINKIETGIIYSNESQEEGFKMNTINYLDNNDKFSFLKKLYCEDSRQESNDYIKDIGKKDIIIKFSDDFIKIDEDKNEIYFVEEIIE